MDVADLFELERALQGDGVMDAPPQKERMRFVDEAFGPVGKGGLGSQDRGQCSRQMAKRV